MNRKNDERLHQIDFKSNAIHGGRIDLSTVNAISPPIYQSASFSFDSFDEIESIFSF